MRVDQAHYLDHRAPDLTRRQTASRCCTLGHLLHEPDCREQQKYADVIKLLLRNRVERIPYYPETPMVSIIRWTMVRIYLQTKSAISIERFMQALHDRRVRYKSMSELIQICNQTFSSLPWVAQAVVLGQTRASCKEDMAHRRTAKQSLVTEIKGHWLYQPHLPHQMASRHVKKRRTVDRRVDRTFKWSRAV